MTTEEIKSEIQKSLEKVPETVLRDILDFLREAERQPADKLALARNVREILAEDKELLERLGR